MRKKINFKISYLITVFLFVLFILCGWLFYLIEFKASEEKIISDEVEKFHTDLTHLQALLNAQLIENNLKDARLNISISAQAPDIKKIILLDKNNQIILSSKSDEEGQTNHNTALPDRDSVNRAIELRQKEIIHAESDNKLYAYYPVVIESASKSRAERIGVLYAEKDLSLSLFKERQFIKKR